MAGEICESQGYASFQTQRGADGTFGRLVESIEQLADEDPSWRVVEALSIYVVCDSSARVL